MLEQIQSVLSKPAEPTPFIIWSDPAREWKELLQKTCGDTIELWAGEGHELLLRHRFIHEERRPRVIWLPRRKDKDSQECKELYLLRNMPKGRGIGLFEPGNFYPDFQLH